MLGATTDPLKPSERGILTFDNSTASALDQTKPIYQDLTERFSWRVVTLSMEQSFANVDTKFRKAYNSDTAAIMLKIDASSVHKQHITLFQHALQ
jgi:hypothetical protein